MKEKAIAYLGGFFDGEGCITIERSNRKRDATRRDRTEFVLSVAAYNLCRKPLELFLKHFGGMLYFNKGSRVWRWRLCSAKALLFIRVIYPYLKVKRAQARVALSFGASLTGYKMTSGKFDSREKCRQALIGLRAKIKEKNSPERLKSIEKLRKEG